MKAAYIGILEPGSTSRMRALALRDLTPGMEWDWIDTYPPMRDSAPVWRSLAFRYHRGKTVGAINELVAKRVARIRYDLVWIDKGVFLERSTVELVRRAARRLVHYTPDTAFHANRSRHFNASLPLFDLAITTKSFELDEYHRRIGAGRTLVTTQGYDKSVHYPRVPDSARRREAVFVGLAEPAREGCIATLLNCGIPVRLAGHGWGSFVRRRRNQSLLTFEGDEVFGDDYARMLSSAWIGLGLLSKRFPELHTTRTFEIPACGAVLATERNAETRKFLAGDEALFFENSDDLASGVIRLFSEDGTDALAAMGRAGRHRVERDGRDNKSILRTVMADSRLAG